LFDAERRGRHSQTPFGNEKKKDICRVGKFFFAHLYLSKDGGQEKDFAHPTFRLMYNDESRKKIFVGWASLPTFTFQKMVGKKKTLPTLHFDLCITMSACALNQKIHYNQ
jgi:hypothetical protein